jgi:hypothetical protein
LSVVEASRKDEKPLLDRVCDFKPNPEPMFTMTTARFESSNPWKFVEGGADLDTLWVYTRRVFPYHTPLVPQ